MQQIINAMSDFGLSVESPVADGQIHRCRSSAKAKKNKDGWYLINPYGDHYYAVFGCWIRGEKCKASTKEINGDKKGADKAWQILEERRIAAELEKLNKAKKTVKNFLDKFPEPASPDHYYLINKDVGVWGDLQQCEKALILPVLNEQGEATSYQIISQSSRKRFLYQGVVGGGCFPIPGDSSTTICICEGYSTGASIREATGYKVLVAFNAGNMYKVAQKAARLFPDKEILICADNDHVKEKEIGKNTGLEVAKKIKDKLGFNFVFPTNIDGSDFNDMAAEQGLSSVKDAIFSRDTIECMTQEDCQEGNESLDIPIDLPLPGLIGQGLESLEGDILQYSLPLVLTVISRAIAGKISLNSIHPNVFNIKVGGTSTSKTQTDDRFKRCVDTFIPGFKLTDEIASGPGLWRAVAANPQGMAFFDEVSSLFIRNNSKGGVDTLAEGKINALLDIYSRSGMSFKKAFGDPKNAIDIQNLCVSIIGNATPTIFENLEMTDFETGLLQRFDFWRYDGEIKEKHLLIGSNYFSKTQAFVGELDLLMKASPFHQKDSLASLIDGCVDLGVTPDAVARIKEFSKYIIKEANKADSEGETGIISRRFDLALKYALIHHAAVKGVDGLYDDVDLTDIEWGIKVATMLSNWKLTVLTNKVTAGDFHRDSEYFKGAIIAAVRAGKNPSFSYMASRRKKLKNWPFKYSEQVIGVLKKRGEIITREGRGGSTLYYLPKNYQP